ncbi:receptor-like protein 36 [Hibiscus syriacus]|uniref:receptor-like protein 36 n=1 Tax=Hibiscus syriacus TaxID=106335 RepID=UPI0019209A28|nr:receptor-like protein 36 [Hibiscus syriacus]
MDIHSNCHLLLSSANRLLEQGFGHLKHCCLLLYVLFATFTIIASMIMFKESFLKTINASSNSSSISTMPRILLSSKFELWDLNTDCCSWEGVTCGDAIGPVIGLDPRYNKFKGSIPSSLFTLPSLQKLFLQGNQLVGKIDEFLNASFSNDHLTGPIPKSILQFPRLEELYIGDNSFSSKKLDMSFQLNNLRGLDLSNISLLIESHKSLAEFPKLESLELRSCNLPEFPEFIKTQDKLYRLDLSNNTISGAAPYLHLFAICRLENVDASDNNLSGPIPNCLGNLSTLQYLDLQGNNFSGILPKFSKASQLWFLKVSKNRLEGKLPRSLVKCNGLGVLGVGNNMMSDTFPFWLEKLPDLAVLILRENRFYGQIKHLKHKISFPTLDVLDIASNQFSGELAIDYLNATQLRSLKIGGNRLEGKLPTSLANFIKLEVLDLGNNMIHDTFPFRLEKLPSLKVLILRGNRFYGSIAKFDTKRGFPKLRILDIASNNFSGDSSIEFLQSLKAMMQVTDGDKAPREYIGEEYYQDSVMIVNKGIKMVYEKVLTILTCLDLSNNSFHGRIHEEIQILMSLRMLNLSHNSLSGKIPSALDNLKVLESLDLSQNKLSGEIPPQLASLV